MAEQQYATEQEIKDWIRLPDGEKELPGNIRAVLMDIARTGALRYDWMDLRPVVWYMLDKALADFDAAVHVEVGPPAPLPGATSLSELRERFHLLLDGFDEGAPFTLQRLCELLLEPRAQYKRLEKLALALDKLLTVTTTLPRTHGPPLPLPAGGAADGAPAAAAQGEAGAAGPSSRDGPPGQAMANGVGEQSGAGCVAGAGADGGGGQAGPMPEDAAAAAPAAVEEPGPTPDTAADMLVDKVRAADMLVDKAPAPDDQAAPLGQQPQPMETDGSGGGGTGHPQTAAPGADAAPAAVAGDGGTSDVAGAVPASEGGGGDAPVATEVGGEAGLPAAAPDA